MNQMPVPNESIKQYLAQVCRHVKAKSVHQDIELEMKSHLDELVEDKQGEGLSEEEAVQQALAKMGDPNELGKQLHAAHKPVIEWSLVILVAIMVGIGLLAMYAVQMAYSSGHSLDDAQLFAKKVVYATVGILLMVVICFFDYQKWQKYSWHLYGATIILIIACSLWGTYVNGAKSYFVFSSFSFDVYGIAAYLFMIAFAGTLLMKEKEKQGRYSVMLYLVKMVLLYALVPAYLYAQAKAFTSFIPYVFGMTILMLFVAKTYELFVACVMSWLATGWLLVTSNPRWFHYTWKRYTAYINPNTPYEETYFIRKTEEAIHSAGMWGKGFGVENTLFPYIHGEMIFTYLIYSLGWIFGISMVIVTLLLIGKVINVARRLKDTYARGIVIGLFSIIGLHFVWNILMSFGFAPINSMPLPFVSFGGTNTIMELIATGLVLSVYRRKNMVSYVDRELIK